MWQRPHIDTEYSDARKVKIFRALSPSHGRDAEGSYQLGAFLASILSLSGT
jgi:hypothetical protein